MAAQIATSVKSRGSTELVAFDRDSILVYSRDELQRINEALANGVEHCRDFWSLLLHPNDAKRRQLSAEPLMAEALIRVRADRKNDLATEQQ